MPPGITKEDIIALHERLNELLSGQAAIQNQLTHTVTKEECLETRMEMGGGNPGKPTKSTNSERWWLRLIVGIGTVALALYAVIILAIKVAAMLNTPG